MSKIKGKFPKAPIIILERYQIAYINIFRVNNKYRSSKPQGSDSPLIRRRGEADLGVTQTLTQPKLMRSISDVITRFCTIPSWFSTTFSLQPLN